MRIGTGLTMAGGAATGGLSGRKVHKSALALLPDPGTPLYHAIQTLRVKHDKHIQRWPPHVNLLYPFVPDDEFDDAASLLHSALTDITSFDVTMARFGHFQHGRRSSTVWLAPQDPAASGDPQEADPARPTPHPELLRLQGMCQSAIPFCNDSDSFGGFTPHHSIGHFTSLESVISFMGNQVWEPVTWRIKEVCLISRVDQETPFQVRYRVPLGGQGAVVRLGDDEGVYRAPAIPRPSSSSSSSKGKRGKGRTMPGVIEGAGASAGAGGSGITEDAPQTELTLDGSIMEGGGQILRVSSALATLLKVPFRLSKVRAGRAKPGLQPQHLTGLQRIAELGGSSLYHGTVGSTDIVLVPGQERPEADRFVADTRTAGSITLLLQAALPVMALGAKQCTVICRGGTTVSHSPSIDYLLHVTLPVLARMGVKAEVRVIRRGYYPVGGGEVHVEVTPSALQSIDLSDTGAPVAAKAFVCGVVTEGGRAQSVAMGLTTALEAATESVVGVRPTVSMNIETLNAVQGKGGGGGGRKRARWGNKREVMHVLLVVETSTGCMLATDRLVESSEIADACMHGIVEEVVGRMKEFLDAGACCDEHLCDQVVIWAALAKGRSVIRGPPTKLITSQHLPTAVYFTELLTGVRFKQTEDGDGGPRVLEVEGMGFQP